MFYIVPVRGLAFCCGYGEYKESVNVLDTVSNTVQRLSLNVVDGLTLGNARLKDGSIRLFDCAIEQCFGDVHTSLFRSGNFCFDDISYKCKMLTDKGIFQSLELTGGTLETPAVLLNRQDLDIYFSYFTLSHVVKVSDYYIIPAELTGWGDTMYVVVLLLAFDKEFNYAGSYLSCGSNLVKHCSSMDKALSAKLAMIGENVYF